MSFLARFLYLLYTYGMPVLCSITLLIGLIIMYRKDQLTRILGIWAISHGLGGVLSGMYTLIKSHLSVNNVTTINTSVTILQMLLAIITVLAIFLYAKYRYNAKGLIAVILIELISIPLFAVISEKFLTTDFLEFEKLYRVTYIFNIFKSLVNVAAWLIILYPFYKNRERERDLPKLWIYIAVYVFFLVINNLSNLILAISGPFDLGAIEVSNFCMVIIADLGMFVSPLTAIYILRKGKELTQSSKKKGR